MTLEVHVSPVCGLCYGSTNAVTKTKESLKENKKVVLYKEILHNQNVISDLEKQGAVIKNDLKELEKDDFVIIRGHGEPLSTFKYFEDNKINYLDCTCPNVKAINLLVKEKSEQGYKIILLGKHGFNGKPMHPEVYATIGWCTTSPILIEDESEIKSIDLSYEKYYLVVQTTFSRDKSIKFISLIEELMNTNQKEFDYRNTICNAQKNINKAAEELAKEMDIMIVIVGKNSSNPKELYNNFSSIKETYFIENPVDILGFKNVFNKKDNLKVGITAGASTMKEDVLQVKEILERL